MDDPWPFAAANRRHLRAAAHKLLCNRPLNMPRRGMDYRSSRLVHDDNVVILEYDLNHSVVACAVRRERSR